MAWRILIGMSLFFSSWAHANCNSDAFVNEQYIEHLNYYYRQLNVAAKPGSEPQKVYFELQILEEYQVNKSTNKALLPPPNLVHISCSGGPCGGCSHGPC